MTKIYTDNGKTIFKLFRTGRDESPWEEVCPVKGSVTSEKLTMLIKSGYAYMTRYAAQNKYGDLPEEG